MKSKMGKEGSKKCDNKKAVRAMVGSKDCWHRDFELSLTSRGQDQASDCLGSFSFLQIPSQKSVGQTPLDRSTTSQAASFVRRGFTKGAVPPHPSSPPGPWGQALSAGGSSQTHCLDWCWVSLTAGEEFLSSPWLIPAHQFPHLLFTNRSTHCQLRRQRRPVP